MDFYNEIYFTMIEDKFGCMLEYVNFANLSVTAYLDAFVKSDICSEIQNGNHIYIDCSALSLVTRFCKEAKDFYETADDYVITENIYYKIGQIFVWLQNKLQISFSAVLEKYSLKQIKQEINSAEIFDKAQIVKNIIKG